MTLEVAENWFDWVELDDGVTLIWEPHVDPLIRCNIWHVRGEGRDLLVDSGLGIASLSEAAASLFRQPLTAVATHTHYDHVGSLHEFEERVVHRLEAEELREPRGFAALRAADFEANVAAIFHEAGFNLPELMLEALPRRDYDVATYALRPAPASQLVEEGDVIEAGERRFEVLHLPGHSPGSIGLWEVQSGILFSGDAIYDAPLLDTLPGSDVAAYVATMKRLLELPVRVVHAGHDASFGRERLHELARAYLELRA
jgi:glyoxylase-like metal-dependent hydrolase (beta-lactamase superfamily II)